MLCWKNEKAEDYSSSPFLRNCCIFEIHLQQYPHLFVTFKRPKRNPKWRGYKQTGHWCPSKTLQQCQAAAHSLPCHVGLSSRLLPQVIQLSDSLKHTHMQSVPVHMRSRAHVVAVELVPQSPRLCCSLSLSLSLVM